MNTAEAIEEARENAAKNYATEPVVIRRLLDRISIDEREKLELRELLWECYERLAYREHCGGLPDYIQRKVVRNLPPGK